MIENFCEMYQNSPVCCTNIDVIHFSPYIVKYFCKIEFRFYSPRPIDNNLRLCNMYIACLKCFVVTVIIMRRGSDWYMHVGIYVKNKIEVNIKILIELKGF